jgi:hypothetical protein
MNPRASTSARRRWQLLVLPCLVLAAAQGATAAPETRFHQLTRKFARTPDQARVLSAGYLGGPGTEWLVGGGFQSDGTIVVAGVALGPTLQLGTAPVRVLGTDAPAPRAPEPRQKRERDRPAIDRGFSRPLQLA